ncbi:MAG: hypothetical protein QW292_13020, partial [Candidatus Parvarchaeota archaeon]
LWQLLVSHRMVMKNKRISRKRALVEYPFAIMKRVFHFSHTLVTLSRRVRVKAAFLCIGYNLFTLLSMKNKGRIAVAIKS